MATLPLADREGFESGRRGDGSDIGVCRRGRAWVVDGVLFDVDDKVERVGVAEGSVRGVLRGVEFSSELVAVDTRHVGAEGGERAAHAEFPTAEPRALLGHTLDDEFGPVAVDVVAHGEHDAHALGDTGDVVVVEAVRGEVEGLELAVDPIVDAVGGNELEQGNPREGLRLQEGEGLEVHDLLAGPVARGLGDGPLQVEVELGGRGDVVPEFAVVHGGARLLVREEGESGVLSSKVYSKKIALLVDETIVRIAHVIRCAFFFFFRGSAGLGLDGSGWSGPQA